MARKFENHRVQVFEGQIIVTLEGDELDEIVDCLDTWHNVYRLSASQEDLDFNRGLRKKMINKARKANRLTNG